MTFQIIIKGKNSYGKTRSEQEDNLRKDGLKGMSEENHDKCKWLEKKHWIKDGFTPSPDLEKIGDE